ncbi:filamentous hemagglutinin N-terminal domain-containing protein [Planctomicrobium sp. SH668]|uniref:two-partner secretion domain-containing protein n=1 Tax=Planctomicrobium sp. SH668 TaxID=3448126 RepID=UPI003F5C8126
MTAISLLAATPALALPQGGQMVGGQASIATTGHQTTITQSTQRGIINWQSFDIGQSEGVHFQQPSAASVTLNRVTGGGGASQLLGNLTANGTVMLVNPQGTFIGPNASVNVGSFLATTSDISNDRFMAGDYRFDMPGNPNAGIVNLGSVTVAEAGLAAFVAPNVVNNGLIQAKLGKVQLASGDTFTLDLYGDGLFALEASPTITSQLVTNGGIIAAEGGKVLMTAAAAGEVVNSLINIDGIISATSIGEQNGEIVIFAEGSNAVTGNDQTQKGQKQGSSTVLVSGIIDASGRKPGERGGKITVTGDHVALLDGTLIDASGHTGESGTTVGKAVSAHRDGSAGGDIRIGGDYLGQGDTPTARYLYVDPGALIVNDALFTGDAGRSIFWSDGNTQFYGNVYARALGGQAIDALTWSATAGGNHGDGGFVETSGYQHLDAGGYVNLTASSGEKGTYFLDPTDITIYGNVDPAFQSTDGSIDLASSLKLWLDASDTSKVTLTYSTDGLSGATATGTAGSNTITTSTDVAASLTVGARIRLGVAGAVTTADTMGADTYTVASITGTTITLGESLTQNYTDSALRRGLVSQLADKSGQNNNATQATAANMPLWVSNGQNELGLAKFDGNDTLRNTNFIVNTANLSILALFQETLASENRRFFDLGNSSGDVNSLYVSVDFKFGAGFSAGYRIPENSPASHGVANTSLALISYVKSGSSSQTSWWNGVSSSTNTSVVTTFDSQRFTIGNQNSENPNNFLNGNGYELLLYTTDLSVFSRGLMEQYQSAKWGIALTPPGTGATEVAKATASDGYSAFTTRYLEQLSQSANISLQATNDINLDFKGDTLSLASGRDLTLTAGNNITSASAGTIQTAGTGSILLSAGGDINLSHDLDLTTTGTGSVTLRANNSILYSGGGDITTQGGAITLNSNRDASGAGAISLGSGTLLTSNGGNITLGGGVDPLTTAALGTASNVQGIRLVSAMLNAQGGNISLRGQGDAASTISDYLTSAHGLFLNDSTLQTNGGGTIALTGLGGGADSSGSNFGVSLYAGSTVSAQNGTITINGTGGHGSSSSIGLSISGLGTNTIHSTGSGSILISGTGNGSAHGVHLNSATGGIYSTTGSVAVTGISGASGSGLKADNAGFTLGGATATGDITLTGDRLSLGGNVTTRTSGTVTIRPYTASTSIGIGGATGMLDITSAILNSISAGTLSIGRSDGTGLMRVAGTNLSARDYHLSLINGSGNIQLDGGVTALALGTSRNFSAATTSGHITAPTAAGTITTTRTGSGGNITMTAGGSGTINVSNLTLNANNGGEINLTSAGAMTIGTMNAGSILARTTDETSDLTIASGKTLSASASGNAITLAAGRNFINNAGSGVLSTPSGRWLVYSTNPADDTIDTLTNDFRRFSCTYGGSCPSFPASGKGFLYGSTPLLTVSPTGGLAVTYGDVAPNLSGYAYTLSGYLDSDATIDSMTGSLAGTTPYTQGASVGNYAISHASGTLASALGYEFTYASNATGITVAPASLTVTANAISKLYGAADPALTYGYFGLANGDTSAVFTGGLSRAAGETVTGSPYAIGLGTLSAGSNYTIDYTGADFIIRDGFGDVQRIILSVKPVSSPPYQGDVVATDNTSSPTQDTDLSHPYELSPASAGHRPRWLNPEIAVAPELQQIFDLPPYL